ncbi:Sodium-dependent noradrenaline transporter-like [Homarus americanus]|uniref:Transporter n=1 Tax=Homarus americanus TaxID=6706 RepID=A0A8J5ML72_HOMAM|nr:Sodium-dependent noradrenaline transporter-like [Homarus americanus]
MLAEVEDPTSPHGNGSRFIRGIKYLLAYLLGPVPERDTWHNNVEGILSHIGYVVGLGNMWRFPYFCYKHGGATFFIPYTVFLLVVGLPEFFMDVSLGQYLSLGPTHVYSYMAPIFSGLGWAMVAMSLVVSVYYIVVLGWTLYYLFLCFQPTPPWSRNSIEYSLPDSQMVDNITYVASWKFFREEVLVVSSPYEFEIQGHLVLCVGVAWLLVMTSLVRGVRSSGKVAYVTVIVPYIVLVLLLAWSYDTMHQDVWRESLRNYFSPHRVKSSKLLDPELWADAATQVSFSLGAVYGGHTTLSSYNTFKQNTFRNSIVIILCNTATSILCGFVVFVSLSQMAVDMSITVDDVFNGEYRLGGLGAELVFIAYPAFFSRMTNNVWPVLFFLMILALGIDSMIGFMETSTTALFDNFKCLRRLRLPVMFVMIIFLILLDLPLCAGSGIFVLGHMATVLTAVFDNFECLRRRYVPVVAVTCGTVFLLGLPLYTSSGIYLVMLLNSPICRSAVVILALLQFVLECFNGFVSSAGFKEFMKLVEEEMQVWIPRPVYWYLALTLKFLAPLSLLGLLVWTVVGEPQVYAELPLPFSYRVVGWSLTLIISCGIIPVFAIRAIYHNRNQGWRKLFKKTNKFLPRYIMESQSIYDLEQH